MKRGITGLTNEIGKSGKKVVAMAKAVQKDYAYLNDDMPLEGWAWEFIRRNPHYIALYNEIESDFRTIDVVKGDTDLQDIHDNILDSPISKKLGRVATEFGIRIALFFPKTHDANNFMNIENLDFQIEIPNPTKKYNQFCRKTPDIEGATCVKCFRAGEEDETAFWITPPTPNHCYDLVVKQLPPIHPSDTLYLGISLSGKKGDIMKKVGAFLDHHGVTAKERARDDKWNYYLITYDLYKADNKYKDIADILSVAYEEEIKIEDVKNATEGKRKKDKRKLFDERNIENYYKNALALINGEYKKYLYLKK